MDTFTGTERVEMRGFNSARRLSAQSVAGADWFDASCRTLPSRAAICSRAAIGSLPRRLHERRHFKRIQIEALGAIDDNAARREANLETDIECRRDPG